MNDKYDVLFAILLESSCKVRKTRGGWTNYIEKVSSRGSVSFIRSLSLKLQLFLFLFFFLSPQRLWETAGNRTRYREQIKRLGMFQLKDMERGGVEEKCENVILTFLQSVIALAHQLVVGTDVKYINQHLRDLFTNKWQRPCEYIHKVWKPIGMWRTVELSYVHYIIFIF